MANRFQLWGQAGWASAEVVGETHYAKSIRALFGPDFNPQGTDITVPVQLIPDRSNRHDRNAVGVWSDNALLGHLPRPEAARYVGVLTALTKRKLVPEVTAQIHGREWGEYEGRPPAFVATIRLDLGEPHMLVPANDPPVHEHRLLPTGSALQVNGQEQHVEALAAFQRPEGECWAYVTLHEMADHLVEVRLGDARVGDLSPKTSFELVPVLRYQAERGLVVAARAVVKSNAVKTEVMLYVARVQDLPETWVGPSARAGAVSGRVTPVSPAATPVVPATPGPDPVGPGGASTPGWVTGSDAVPSRATGSGDGAPAWATGSGASAPAWSSASGGSAPSWSSGAGGSTPAWTSGSGDAAPAWTSGTHEAAPAWTSGTGDAAPAWTSGTGDAAPAWTSGTGDAGQTWTPESGEVAATRASGSGDAVPTWASTPSDAQPTWMDRSELVPAWVQPSGTVPSWAASMSGPVPTIAGRPQAKDPVVPGVAAPPIPGVPTTPVPGVSVSGGPAYSTSPGAGSSADSVFGSSSRPVSGTSAGSASGLPGRPVSGVSAGSASGLSHRPVSGVSAGSASGLSHRPVSGASAGSASGLPSRSVSGVSGQGAGLSAGQVSSLTGGFPNSPAGRPNSSPDRDGSQPDFLNAPTGLTRSPGAGGPGTPPSGGTGPVSPAGPSAGARPTGMFGGAGEIAETTVIPALSAVVLSKHQAAGTAPVSSAPDLNRHAPIPPAPTGIKFAVPPGWPVPPDGWYPPEGWHPDASWPPAPAGWQWWVPTWE
ncbi:Transcription elongation factor spt5 [Actinoplanes sp. SE50]|uniref:transcription elongation factor Spt5 n=1 Tax=unclassified Actinoplanes TaxID=2626549 RepID=UPI00023EC147|nr:MULTISPECIES: transcription elongation factor Spt5 [unclassified Actinoplanes]AEV86338.1 Transcription elongation factor spt5 [Actinoplanes sp. SE50/110]ATO84735.1 Transcription elongation factor spt5 [Actinoplanes sp. SE50]SLM02145.1 transcription elongation factor Spt5 [Actinoplanes sp. SE50/110]